MLSKTDSNDNWDVALLTFAVLILLFIWFYNFLFISPYLSENNTNPTNPTNTTTLYNLASSDSFI